MQKRVQNQMRINSENKFYKLQLFGIYLLKNNNGFILFKPLKYLYSIYVARNFQIDINVIKPGMENNLF